MKKSFPTVLILAEWKMEVIYNIDVMYNALGFGDLFRKYS